MRKPLRAVFWTLGLLAAGGGGFVVWGSTPAKPMPEVFSLVGSLPDETSNESWLTFVPDGGPPQTGLILYPGARVDYRAYAPTAQAIADNGYFVIIVRMPLNFAIFDASAAADVIAAYPEIEHWAVGGHSLGGAMAANFIHSNPGAVDGLVLWASFPASSDNLSSSGVRVVSISGTLDGLATPEKIAASVPLLPADTVWIPIEGGNHAQFGWYGEQSGDNPATISRENQQEQIVQATAALLASLK